MWHGRQNQPNTPREKESGGCNLTETDQSWWSGIPPLLRDASNDLTKTSPPPDLPSLSLFTTANKEWSDRKLHSLLLSHPKILRKMSRISGEPQGGHTRCTAGTTASLKANTNQGNTSWPSPAASTGTQRKEQGWHRRSRWFPGLGSQNRLGGAQWGKHQVFGREQNAHQVLVMGGMGGSELLKKEQHQL